MSNEMASFMKEYCRKWKAKSIFQVLLMYRAMKHQDTVYMSQQVLILHDKVTCTLGTANRQVQVFVLYS